MLLGALSVAGCVTSGPANDYCILAGPIYLSRVDVLSERTEDAVIRHNERFEAVCGIAG
jgi:hypothetical protein